MKQKRKRKVRKGRIRPEQPQQKSKKFVYIALIILLGGFIVFFVVNNMIRQRELDKLREEEAKKEAARERRELEKEIIDYFEQDLSNVKSDTDVVVNIMTCLKNGYAYYIDKYNKLGICGLYNFDIYWPEDRENQTFSIIQNAPIKTPNNIKRIDMLVEIHTPDDQRQSYLETKYKTSRPVKNYLEDGKLIQNITIDINNHLADLYLPFRTCLFTRDVFYGMKPPTTDPTQYKNIFVILYKDYLEDKEDAVKKDKIVLTTTLFLRDNIGTNDEPNYEYNMLFLENGIPKLSNGYLDYKKQAHPSIFGESKNVMVNGTSIQNVTKEEFKIEPYKFYNDIVDWSGDVFDLVYV